ncbi:MAG: GntR family transcriptional regulator [Pseudolabrys sp.]|nr:GntR family transcriptional regulator [Pseudolabrys sp.]
MSRLQKTYNRSRVPLYIQVSSVMRQRIESDQWRLGQKIPTLVELEKEFQVARVTVREAIEILHEEGLLHCQQGRGTFVVDKPHSRHWVKLATDWNVLVASIKENVLRRIKVDNPSAFPVLAEGEGELAPGYVYLRSLQFKNDQPYGLVNVHLANHIYERDPEAFMEHPALCVLVELNDVGVQHAHQTVVIGSANLEQADLLKIALSAPTAECRCIVIDDVGIAIYVADITYRSDAIKLHIDLFAGSRPPGASRPRKENITPALDKNASDSLSPLRSP